MAITADQFAAQMIAQLQVQDPSISALVGTPERKIFDTVAQALADNQVDLTGLSSALDVNSKYGSNLDQFTSLFGFARQAAAAATGYVTFSRNTAAPSTIQITSGVSIQCNVATTSGLFYQYVTTAGGTIQEGQTTSSPVPVACVTTGSAGNAAVNTLTQIVGNNPPAGITAVTNANPITGGTDVESDASYKVRFQNTVFRNLAGTEDQYLSLAVSTSFTSKANVIGPISQYLEYIQVPDEDDAGYLNGTQTTSWNTGGLQGHWTTALSAIPYAQDIYTNITPFISTNASNAPQYFYTDGTDFIFNYPPYIAGDAGSDSGSHREDELSTTIAPNWTFLNVWNPASGATPTDGLQTATPGEVFLSEFSYLSSASRNSIEHNVYNAVDVYVDGSDPTLGSSIFLPANQVFTVLPTNALYIDNFRRDGDPAMRPHPGNFYTPLMQSPLTSIPATIIIGTNSYYLGIHYWLVHDVGPLGGSIRSRDGIEWSSTVAGDTSGVLPATPQSPMPTGYGAPGGDGSHFTINNLPTASVVEVDDYNYDANISVLQASLENARQITTDVLCHSARTRYFKFDLTAVYSPSANPSATNVAANVALQAYLSNQYFGSVIQLDNIINTVYGVPGVQNVRWSNDLPSLAASDEVRAIETDQFGNPLHQPRVDRIIDGSASTQETQRLYLPGAVAGNTTNFGVDDYFQLQYFDVSGSWFITSPIFWNAISATSIHTALTNGTSNAFGFHSVTSPSSDVLAGIGYGYGGVGSPSSLYSSLSGVFVDSFPVFAKPTASFLIVFAGNGTPVLPTVVTMNVSLSPYTFDSDFYLLDDELPSLPLTTASGTPGINPTVSGSSGGPFQTNTTSLPGTAIAAGGVPTGIVNDTVPGLIVRPRAQNTFTRPGIG